MSLPTASNIDTSFGDLRIRRVAGNIGGSEGRCSGGDAAQDRGVHARSSGMPAASLIALRMRV